MPWGYGYLMTKTYDRNGTVVRRVIRAEGWVITQVRQHDGAWWNIDVRRA